MVNNYTRLGHVFIILVLATLSFCLLLFPQIEVDFCDRKDCLARWISWVLGSLWSGGHHDDDGGHVPNGLVYIVAMNELKLVSNVLQRLVKLSSIV